MTKNLLILLLLIYTVSSACVNNCYNHGICISRSCKCFDGYTGLYCEYHVSVWHSLKLDSILFACFGIAVCALGTFFGLCALVLAYNQTVRTFADYNNLLDIDSFRSGLYNSRHEISSLLQNDFMSNTQQSEIPISATELETSNVQSVTDDIVL